MAHTTSASTATSSPASLEIIRNGRHDAQYTPRAIANPPADQDSAAATFLDSSRSSVSSDNGPSPSGLANGKPVSQLRNASSNQHLRRPPPYAAPSSDDLKKSPKERLQALLASASTPAPTSTAATTPARKAIMQEQNGPQNPPLSPMFESRNSRDGPSPTTTPRTTTYRPSAATGSQYTAPRNTSLDSTLSSRSSNTSAPTAPSSATAVHSPKPSLELSSSGELDCGAFIAASGSAEGAIHRLYKDKQLLATRNDQLWKLVEKQRAMILGLNKDLDKLVKEREKHRQKLKVQQEALESKSSRDRAPDDDHSVLNESVIEMTQQSKPAPSAARALIGSRADLTPHQKTGSQDFESVSLASDDLRKAIPAPLSMRRGYEDAESLRTPPSNAISPSMSSPGDNRRKAPPKRLNIGQSATGPVLSELSEGPQGEVSDGEELSPEDLRGRRKTREEDDRDRAASHAAKENEASSRSKKSTSKGKSKPPAEGERAIDVFPAPKQAELPAGLNNTVGLPSSPRAPLLGGLQSPLQQAGLGSIGGMLTRPATTINGPQIAAFSALKSPGLPMSPRPGDRPPNAPVPRAGPQLMAAPLMSPGPMSARGGLLSPRPPRQPILLPSNHLPHNAESFAPQDSSLAERLKMQQTSISPTSSSFSDLGAVGLVYQGFVSADHPGLLLPPKALSYVDVQVYSSRLRPARHTTTPNKAGEEDLFFTLAVHARADGRQLWRLEKTLQNVFALDHGLRRVPGFAARLPERNLFSGHAPSRVDQRRAALDQYFSMVLDSPLPEKSYIQICSFLSTDVVGPKVESPITTSQSVLAERSRKEGFLSKKGKSFGGWKSRYFVLDGQDFQYYEGPGGQHLGTIRLHRAQIGPQKVESSSDESEYRHALMILELKREDSASLIRHVLCAESDADRDEWIDALRTYIDGAQDKPSPTANSTSPQQSPTSSPRQPGLKRTKPGPTLSSVQDNALQLQSLGYDQTLQAEAPKMGSPTDSHGSLVEELSEFGAPSLYSLQSPGIDRPAISGPVAGGPIQNSTAWGNKSTPSREKRNIFGFKSKTPEDANLSGQQRDLRNGPPSARLHSGRPVFGMPLMEAVQLFPPTGVNICLPAVVYRCIEYLEARDAVSQVGIFRESGAVLTIEGLQERFNIEGDVNLLEGERYENHAVATLLKRYLRDLPESVLTRELHLDFLKVLEAKKHGEKVAAINILAHRLPEANFELLATLSRYLLEVVRNSDRNLMTEKNIAICVAQSINIPIPLFIMFMTDHGAIFDESSNENVPPIIQEIDSKSAKSEPTFGTDDLRSPRKQLFTDLATPLPNQSSFGPDIYNHQPHHSNNPQLQTFNPTGMSPYHNYRPVAVPPPQLHDPGAAQGFGSLNAALAPSTSASPVSASQQSPTHVDPSRETKKSRRESGVRGLVISSPLIPPSSRLRDIDER